MDATVARVFQETARIHRDRPAVKIKDGEAFSPVSYGELYERVRQVGTGLIDLGLVPGEKIGLVSDNRPEWIVCDLACICIGVVDVPRGSDSTPREIDYILSHADASAVVVEDARQLKKVLSLKARLPKVRFHIVLDPLFDGEPTEGVFRLDDVARRGRERIEGGDGIFEQTLAGVKREDLATIIYTSGTTGEPKGVMLSHRNLMQNIETLPGWLKITEQDRFLSILPPWHVFERMAEYIQIAAGASVAYTNIRTFAADMALEKPTFIASVPRIWEGIYSKVVASVAQQPPKRQKIFNFLVLVSKKYVKSRKILADLDALYLRPGALARLFQRLAAAANLVLLFPLHRFAQKKFAPIRGRTGGELRAAISGGGALPPYVDEFFAAVGITLLEGYGLTETSPVLAARTFDRVVLGTVGPPIPETEIKIVDETGETLPFGEKGVIKVRGKQVMEGYYKKPDETGRVIDDEKWFDTGDLGRMTIRGELAITGRAKETIVLMGGENVEPTPIEDAITESPYIAQAMVVGQDRKILALLVVPNFEALRDRGGLEEMDDAALCADSSVMSIVRDEVRRLVCTERGFRHFERITRFHLLEQEFAVGEELTHTMKKRRNVIADRYASVIDGMYS